MVESEKVLWCIVLYFLIVGTLKEQRYFLSFYDTLIMFKFEAIDINLPINNEPIYIMLTYNKRMFFDSTGLST